MAVWRVEQAPLMRQLNKEAPMSNLETEGGEGHEEVKDNDSTQTGGDGTDDNGGESGDDNGDDDSGDGEGDDEGGED